MARSQVTAEKLTLPRAAPGVQGPARTAAGLGLIRSPSRSRGNLDFRRVHFDDVFQVAAAGGCIYFGSSADNKVPA